MKTWEQKWKNDAPPMDEEVEDALLKLLQGEDDDPSSSLSSGAQKKHCDPTDDSATIDGGVQGGEARPTVEGRGTTGGTTGFRR